MSNSTLSLEFALCAIFDSNLIDPVSSHMLVSKVKPCMSQYTIMMLNTANGSLNQL